MIKPTIFSVVDIETTMKTRLAFDVAWKNIDRKGTQYNSGSYLIEESFKYDVPFFKEKLGYYFNRCWNHYIEPVSLKYIQDQYNNQIKEFIDNGHDVIFCAYNASFDVKYLGETCKRINGTKFLYQPIPMLDIWDFWCQSAPKHYDIKKKETGNPVTKAESVYRFETGDTDFIESHIAFEDVEIESTILLKVLGRKKKMPIVNNPKDFNGQPWRQLLDYAAYRN